MKTGVVIIILVALACSVLLSSQSRVASASDHEALVKIIQQWEAVDRKNRNVIAVQQCVIDVYHARVFDGLAGEALKVATDKCKAIADGTP